MDGRGSIAVPLPMDVLTFHLGHTLSKYLATTSSLLPHRGLVMSLWYPGLVFSLDRDGALVINELDLFWCESR